MTNYKRTDPRSIDQQMIEFKFCRDYHYHVSSRLYCLYKYQLLDLELHYN